jgi:hypothetical protein
MLPDAATEADFLRSTARAQQRIVAAMAERCTVDASDSAALTRSAGVELEAYAHDLLKALSGAVRGAWDEPTVAWITQRHDECLAELGNALCNLMCESGLRHAMAQALQTKMLEADLCLGAALDLHADGVSPV